MNKILVGIVFIFIFLIMYGGATDFFSSYRVFSKGIIITGEVVGINSTSSSDGVISYEPVVKYECAGKTFELGGTGFTGKYWTIGDFVEIYCLESQPDKYILNTFSDKYGGFLFFIIGFGIYLLAIKMYLISKKKEVKKKKN